MDELLRCIIYESSGNREPRSMQVVLQTPTELVVHDGRLSTVLMGALFTASGGGFMWLRWTHPQGWSGNGGPWLVYVVGTMFVLAGLFLFWISGRPALHRGSSVEDDHDRRAAARAPHDDRRAVQCTSTTSRAGAVRPGFRRGRARTDLAHVARRPPHEGTGSRLPWTPYSTSARKSQETCAAAARAFGGWSVQPRTRDSTHYARTPAAHLASGGH